MRVEPKTLVRKLDATCTSALERAVQRAVDGRYYEVVVEHLLLALIEDEDGDFSPVLRHFGVDKSRATAEVERVLQGMRTGNPSRPVFSERLFRWFEDAWVVASLERDAGQVRGADLLLEFLSRRDRYTPETFSALGGIDAPELRRDFATIVGTSKEMPAATEAPPRSGGSRAQSIGREALDRFTISFTERAKDGHTDPIFGRDREIRQLIDILARRRKNNPIIVGEPGVGKTALVEGLAQAIVAGDVPESLRGNEVLSLDLGLLQAGAGVRGELENRLKRVIAEVKASPTPIIVFIDEAHTLMGSGAERSDLPNLLKPALARGEFRTIAATTWSEFKKYFEKDAALERRFQPVKVGEPTVDDTVLMLRGLRATYEAAHRVTIRDEAIVAAADLSHRYISGRLLPDKAVDLLDTAAARVRIEQEATPEALVSLRSQLAGLERERDALRRDTDDGLATERGRLDELERQIDEVKSRTELTLKRWNDEREQVTEMLQAQERLRSAPDEQARSSCMAQLEEARQRLAALQGEEPLMHPEVDRHSVARVVGDWTGIPTGKLRSSSIETLLELEQHLEQRIKGQRQATEAVSEAVRMAHAGVRDPNAPVAVLLFVGPSGVGKTETALALADLLFGGERAMTTINMSEFQEKHTVSRLIGSPPGYVGYGEGGVLTEAVRQRPYSVVLLDECEKADVDVMNLFYQVFDKGQLSDGEGRVIDFRNTVIILTSNLATDQVMQLHANHAQPASEAVAAAIRPTLSAHFKPALLARMTIVPYRPMRPDVLKDIAQLKLDRIGARLFQSHRIRTEFADSLLDNLVARCTEAETGARAIDHVLRGSLLPALARSILERLTEDEMPGRLRVDLDEGGWKLDFAPQ